MAVQISQRVSLEMFEAFINQPENADKSFEYISGEIVEVPSNPYVSKIAAKIITFIGMFLLQQDIGHVTGEAGGYMVGGERYAPDVAFISYARQPELAQQGYNPNPPELAIEVISDTSNGEEQRHLRLKVSGYLAAGVQVWIVDPELREVEIHRPAEAVQTVDEKGTLTAEDILPGFKLAVKDIFPPQKTEEQS